MFDSKTPQADTKKSDREAQLRQESLNELEIQRVKI